MQDEQTKPVYISVKEAIRIRLKRWFASVAGQALLSIEKEQLNEVLPNLFGYHILQVGELGEESLMTSSRIAHQVHLTITPKEISKTTNTVCNSHQLPIEGNSIDVVILPHILEFEQAPHEVLREVERILIGEGHIVIMGFNPLSLWGLWHLFLGWRDEPPWSGHFFRSARICDWLGLLGFDIVKTQTAYFRLPINSPMMTRRLAFLEKLGNYAFSWFGASYLIVGKKRLLPLIPTRTLWRTRRRLISAGVTEARLGSSIERTHNKE